MNEHLSSTLIAGVIILFLCSSTTVRAKTATVDSLTIIGEVYDSFTGLPVEAFLTLINGDSTVVDTITCHKEKQWRKEVYSTRYWFTIAKGFTNLRIKATHPQYEECIVPLDINPKIKSRWTDGHDISMKRSIYKNVDLDGVTVTGTRVQMVYRGDTIIYDASAFALPEGSMLDGLVRQLPGAELKSNGDIYINGEKIDYLTLNGRDFFKGDNKVMLENLPYFTVKDLKVYHKKSDKEEALGIRESQKRDYVMDVELKREYSTGYIVNAEAGIGSEERWLAKLFALGYGERSRYSVFGNVNNVNEEREPGQDGDWSPSKTNQGLVTTRQIGAHYENSDAGKKWEEQFDAKMHWNESDNEIKNKTEIYSTDGDIHGGSYSWNNRKDKSLSLSNNFRWRKPYYIDTRLDFSYDDSKVHSLSLDSTYRSQIINQTDNTTFGTSRSTNGSLSIRGDKQVNNGDYYFFGAYVGFSHLSPGETASLRLTHYENADDDNRNTFDRQKSSSYNFGLAGGFNYNIGKNFSILNVVQYSQDYTDNSDYYYRLDRLKSRYEREIGMLPSTQDSLQMALDADNSSQYDMMTRSITYTPSLNRNTDNGFFQFSVPLKWKQEDLDYQKSTLDTLVRRRNFHPSLSLMWYQWGNKYPRDMAYSLNVSDPQLLSLMPVMSNTNPLSVRINNPNLKSNIKHTFRFSQQLRLDSLRLNLWVRADANITQRATGTRTTYDSTTGAYTYMSDNVDGNWDGSFSLGAGYYFDKKKLFRINLRAGTNYNHSVDFNILTNLGQDTQNTDELSKVNTFNNSLELSLDYRKEKNHFGVRGKINGRHSRSNQVTFTNIDTHDFQYGANITYQIPWVKLDLSTDINMYSRRGYQSDDMNTDDLVWNAQLSKSLFNGKLILKAQGFDILKRINTVQYYINAQGNRETWYNSIPRYFMFSAAIKLTKVPNKDK